MSFSKEIIEQLHNTGKMPDWAYYQQNDKSAAENYTEIKSRYQSGLQEAVLRRPADELPEIEDAICQKIAEDIWTMLSKLSPGK